MVDTQSNAKVLDAQLEGDKIRLMVGGVGDLRDVLTEYVVLGHGYDVDVDRIAFIDPSLARRVARIERAPSLDRHFQSSVPGLYFVGPSTAASFGPLFRFVAGSYYCVPVVARDLSRTRRDALEQRTTEERRHESSGHWSSRLHRIGDGPDAAASGPRGGRVGHRSLQRLQFGSAPESDIVSIRGDIRDVSIDDLAGFDAIVHLAAPVERPLGDLDSELTYDIND